jgi:hypothetical protein
LAEFVADRQRAGIWWCDLPAAHRRIVHHYLNKWGGLEQGLPGLRRSETRRTDEGYGLRHLGAHLLGGGETETLRRLLTLEHEGRNLWFTVQEEEGQVAVFLEDVRRLWAWAREEDARAAAQGDEAPHLGAEIRCALIEASLHSLAGNIPPALLAALVEKGVWTPAQGLAYARQVPEPKQRVETFVSLVPLLLPEQRPQVLAEALAAVREIEWWKSARADALAALAPHLPPDLLAEALAAARKIRDADDRADAMAALAPRLAELGYPQEALAAAREIEKEWQRADVLAILAERLPLELLPEVLAAARDIKRESHRAEALAALAPRLPKEQREQALAEALAAARKIRDADDRARALVALAPRLAELGYPQEALAAAREIRDAYDHAEALAALAPHLPPQQQSQVLAEALAAAREIKWEYARALALATLAPHLPKEQREQVLAEALAAARETEDEDDRADALADLAPRLAELGYPQKALAAAREIEDEDDRADALAALASRLAKLGYYQEALAAAREIELERTSEEISEAVVPYLSLELLTEVLTARWKIGDESACASALEAFTPSTLWQKWLPIAVIALLSLCLIADFVSWVIAILSRDLVPMLAPILLLIIWAIYMARNEDKRTYLRARALTTLAAYLSPKLLTKALATAREIGDAKHRANALAALAPRLPPELLGQTLAAARKIVYAEHRAKALAALVPHLPPEQQLPVLTKALATVRENGDEDDRANALAALAPRLAELPRSALYPLWDETLPLLARRTRRDLLADLRALVPVIHALGGEAAIAETARAIQDVARWWP